MTAEEYLIQQGYDLISKVSTSEIINLMEKYHKSHDIDETSTIDDIRQYIKKFSYRGFNQKVIKRTGISEVQVCNEMKTGNKPTSRTEEVLLAALKVIKDDRKPSKVLIETIKLKDELSKS